MKIKFEFGSSEEITPFSNGMFLILPSPFFKYGKFGKTKYLRIGVLFMQYKASIFIRDEFKLTKQTQTKAG